MISCPLCKSTDLQLIEQISTSHLAQMYANAFQLDIRQVFNGTPEVSYVQCGNCDLRFFFPFFLGNDEFYHHLARQPYYYQGDKWEFALARTYIKPEYAVLEVGCGMGAFAQNLQCFSYTGIELSPGNLPASTPSQSFLCESIENYALNHPNSHDIVVSFQVLEHIADIYAFIQACVDALKPGGILLFGVPSAQTSHQFFCNHVLDLPPHHQSRWTDKALISIGEIFGLTHLGFSREPLSNPGDAAFYLTLGLLRAENRLNPAALVDLSPTHAYLCERALGIIPHATSVYNHILRHEYAHCVVSIYQKPQLKV